jgi:hypothetical protein
LNEVDPVVVRTQEYNAVCWKSGRRQAGSGPFSLLSRRGFLVADGGLHLVHELRRNVCEAMVGAGVQRCLLHDLLLGSSFGYEIAVHAYIATRQRFHLATSDC